MLPRKKTSPDNLEECEALCNSKGNIILPIMFINDELKYSINRSFKEKINPVGVGVELWKFLRTFYVFLGASIKTKVRHVQTFCI